MNSRFSDQFGSGFQAFPGRLMPLLLLICLPVLAQDDDRRFAVILQGTSAGVPTMVPDVDGNGTPDPATCWDLDLVDVKSKRLIGSARDCLSFFNLDGTGVKPVGTTYFYFPQGTLVSRGKNTAQPVLWDPANNPDVNPDVTMVTGAFPAPGSNNILSGTRRFEGARGRVLFSGAVRIHPDGNTVTFSCIFLIDLERPGNR
jgi:hypothetical protein